MCMNTRQLMQGKDKTTQIFYYSFMLVIKIGLHSFKFSLLEKM